MHSENIVIIKEDMKKRLLAVECDAAWKTLESLAKHKSIKSSWIDFSGRCSDVLL